MAKNQEIIENELFTEKIDMGIPEYKFNYDLVSNLYRDVLNDIRLAYVISDDRPEAVKLNWVVLNKSNDTKDVFTNLINTVIRNNKDDLFEIIIKMQELSNEARLATGVGLENERPKDK